MYLGTSFFFPSGCRTGLPNIARRAHHGIPDVFLGTQLQGAILLVKNDLFGDLVDVVPELVGIPMQASVLDFIVFFQHSFNMVVVAETAGICCELYLQASSSAEFFSVI